MKSFKLVIGLWLIIFLLGCKSNEKWEYKVFSVSSEDYNRTSKDAILASKVTPTESELNKLGQDGWELVTSYLEVETAFPNFGDAKYVTGLQPNIRPQRAVLIFKRHFVKPQ